MEQLTRSVRRRVGAAVAGGVALTLAVTGTAVGAPGDPPAPDGRPVDAVLDWTAERQQVDGFGGSFAFHKAGSIQRLGEPLSGRLLDMIFSEDTGIGLDIVRVMVGDGGLGEWGDHLYDGPTETIMPEPGVLVWDQPDWQAQKDEFDSYQVWLMQEAQARGVGTILASVWSPPAWMKENGSVISSGRNGPPNRLREDMYQEFADYLAEYVLGYEEHFGIRITHISPTNEPDFSGGYSSSVWTPEELRRFVRDHLGPTFEQRGVEAKIVLGEGMGFDERFVVPTITDPAAERYVDVVAAHAYTGLVEGGTAPRADAFRVSSSLAKPIWQTEYMNQGAPRDRLFVNNTMSDGLRYAELIANMFDTTGVSAYFWWWPVANNGADGSDLIRLVNDGSPQSGKPTETGQYRVFKRYWTIGQYSRFLDDGYVMIDTDMDAVDGVTVTAYKNEATGAFTVVAVNENEADTEVTFDLVGGFPLPPESKDACKAGGWREFADLGFDNQGGCVSYVESGRTPASALVPYRTSASENMRMLGPISTVDRTFTATLRGRSVTTFVPQAHALPELPDLKDVFSTYLAAENDGADGVAVVADPARGDVVRAKDGGWLRYTNVNFADGSAAGFTEQKGQLRVHAHVRPHAGGQVELRVGDPVSGAVVATLDVPAGADDVWLRVSADVDTSPGAANDIQDMYLVLTGATGDTAAPLFDLAQVEFSD